MSAIVTDIDRLRTICSHIDNWQDAKPVIEEMQEVFLNPVPSTTVGHAGQLAGLAAPQIGHTVRVIAIRGRQNDILWFINPVVTTMHKGWDVGVEGCLSLPRAAVKVCRPQQARIKGYNEHGRYVNLKLNGLMARVACHEADHLFGVLITDYYQTTPYGRRSGLGRSSEGE